MIFLGADHAGFELKEQVKKYLDEHKIEYNDLGAYVYDKADDYPDFGFPVSEKVGEGSGGGILACESAGGMTISANKVKGVRAVECATAAEAIHAREHNNANVLVISKMAILSDTQLHEVLDAWFSSQWTNEDRHARRVDKISQYEKEHWR